MYAPRRFLIWRLVLAAFLVAALALLAAPASFAAPSLAPSASDLSPGRFQTSLTLSKHRLFGNERDSVVATATVLDSQGQPVVGAVVIIKARARNPLDMLRVDQPSDRTDQNGQVQATIRSCFFVPDPSLLDHAMVAAFHPIDSSGVVPVGTPQSLVVVSTNIPCGR